MSFKVFVTGAEGFSGRYLCAHLKNLGYEVFEATTQNCDICDTKSIKDALKFDPTGAEVTFEIEGYDKSLDIFTTRTDTLYGVTYMVLAPEHPFLSELVAGTEYEESVNEYIDKIQHMSDIERASAANEKTGVFIGRYCINPINGKRIPIYISDYVLMDYGTGAIMAVPAHDQRDFEFAKLFDIEIMC